MAAKLCKVKDCKHIQTVDTNFCKQDHLKPWIESPERAEFFEAWKDAWTQSEIDLGYEMAVANFCIRLEHA